MMNPQKIYATILGLLFFVSLNVKAISIKEYIEGALHTNPTTKSALERIQSAEIGVQAARLAYLPKFNLNYSYNYTSMYMPTIESTAKSSIVGVSMSLMLWDSGIRKYSIELAEEALKGTYLGERAVRQALIVQTLKTYAAWDGQSSLEYTYANLRTAIVYIRDNLAQHNKLTNSGRKLLDAKIIEYSEKMQAARIIADTLAIQVEGISGISPKAYIDSSKEEIEAITKFYNDLLLERPLPTDIEAEQNLMKNNLSILASQNGIRSMRLSQLLTRAAMLGPKVSLTGSVTSTKGKSSNYTYGTNFNSPISQLGNFVGVTVSIPIDAQSLKNTQQYIHEEAATALAHEQLIKDLKIAVKVSRINVSFVRKEVSKLKDSLLAATNPSSWDFFKNNITDTSIINFLVYMGSVEQNAIMINSQGGTLFSSTIDFISLIYNLEDYLQELKY